MYQGIRHSRYMLEGRKCHIVTDHHPLTYAFQQNMENVAPRQLDYVSQFTTDIRFIAGEDNVDKDFLSRIESIESSIDYKKIAEAKQSDKETSSAC